MPAFDWSMFSNLATAKLNVKWHSNRPLRYPINKCFIVLLFLCQLIVRQRYSLSRIFLYEFINMIQEYEGKISQFVGSRNMHGCMYARLMGTLIRKVLWHLFSQMALPQCPVFFGIITRLKKFTARETHCNFCARITRWFSNCRCHISNYPLHRTRCTMTMID